MNGQMPIGVTSVSRSLLVSSEYRDFLTAAAPAARGHARSSSILDDRFDSAAAHANEKDPQLLHVKQVYWGGVAGQVVDYFERLAALPAWVSVAPTTHHWMIHLDGERRLPRPYR
eukprot:CAMPEP_0113601620 /NCGR_PEP_ID=MMETSP0017_2-20120614/326_1 /TAXON_ID=2856 /ORGANISM="Cylindrotheca closterium" /LENGTH=114 /DNA_ID=CAMNT_0000509925 /DNA_START=1714 /DNA_END=2058 /DNA_ORIENTATION=- /assembly_acc=CAM_ASM_000147